MSFDDLIDEFETILISLLVFGIILMQFELSILFDKHPTWLLRFVKMHIMDLVSLQRKSSLLLRLGHRCLLDRGFRCRPNVIHYIERKEFFMVRVEGTMIQGKLSLVNMFRVMVVHVILTSFFYLNVLLFVMFFLDVDLLGSMQKFLFHFNGRI